MTGGINAKDFRKMTGGSWNFTHKNWFDSGISLMVTEGFGSVPIGEDIFGLLQEHQGEYAILEGNRPRLILPSQDDHCMMYIRRSVLPIISDPEPDHEVGLLKLSLGMLVRIIFNPFFGVQGKVVAIDRSPSLLPSGIKTYLVTIEANNRKIRTPYLNIEII